MTNTHIDTQSEQDLASNPDFSHSEKDTDSALHTEDSVEMTDNNNLPENNNTENTAENDTVENEEADVDFNNSSSISSTAEPEAPEMKKTDIVIAGITYQIFCPIDGEEDLRSAVYAINNFVLDIKKQSPTLSQENLLLLCCLNLSEKLHSQQSEEDSRRQDIEHSTALLQKIMQDAQSIL